MLALVSDYELPPPPRFMGVLRAEWRVHATALDDLKLIGDSLDWLCDTKDCVVWSKDRSFHGPVMNIGSVRLNRKKMAMNCLKRLGEEVHRDLLTDGLDMRIDDEKNLHVRISLAGLVRGEVKLSKLGANEASVKGTFKIESYPGDDPKVIAADIIGSMI
tara:strand:+ start:399 stop:878 length:480 start_codon:yes stop_codon:yes gene_type:complete